MRMPWSSDSDNVETAEDIRTFSILAMSAAADEDALGQILLHQKKFYFGEDVIGKIVALFN